MLSANLFKNLITLALITLMIGIGVWGANGIIQHVRDNLPPPDMLGQAGQTILMLQMATESAVLLPYGQVFAGLLLASNIALVTWLLWGTAELFRLAWQRVTLWTGLGLVGCFVFPPLPILVYTFVQPSIWPKLMLVLSMVTVCYLGFNYYFAIYASTPIYQ